MKSRLVPVTLSAILLAAACGGKIADPDGFVAPDDPPVVTIDAGPTDAGKGDAGKTDGGRPPRPDAGPSTLDWEACTDPFTGDCATVALPLDRNEPNGKRIDVFVTRFSDPPSPRGSLWLLQGGPGGSISAFEQALQAFVELYPDLTIYGMEHRGVGRSSRLSCENDACVELGSDLGFYSTTAAAGDLHALVGLTSVPGQPTFVYGVSYGTYVAQRYLTMFPTEPAAVVLDSVVPQKGLYFSDADVEGEYPLVYWAQVCEQDAFCSSKFPAPTLPTLRATLAKIPQGHCPDSGLDKASSTLLRQNMLYNELGWSLLPILYRFERCTADDAQVIASFLAQVQQFFPSQKVQPPSTLDPTLDPDDEDQNLATYLNIAFSELWELPPPGQDILESRYRAALLPAGGIVELGQFRETWPVYPADEFVGVYPSTTVPVLTLNGTLDSQTPLDLVHDEVASHYTQPNQSFVVIPNANHGTAVSFFDAPIPCGSLIMQGFLRDPKAPLDTSCTASPTPIGFEGDPDFNAFLFGTDDAWEGTFGPQPRLVPSPALAAKLEQIAARHRLLGR